MKLMIASDIHGASNTCQQLLDAFHAEKADRLVLLGDLLYHGPRNDLPGSYGPKDVITQLNEMRDVLICVRGNCDAEVDQMVLDFPIMADYALLQWGELTLYATHGHLWNEDMPPRMAPGTVLLNGHFHVPACREHSRYLYVNPGSTSIPKGGSAGSYLVLEEGTFAWKDMDGSPYMTYTVDPAKFS